MYFLNAVRANRARRCTPVVVVVVAVAESILLLFSFRLFAEAVQIPRTGEKNKHRIEKGCFRQNLRAYLDLTRALCQNIAVALLIFTNDRTNEISLRIVHEQE